MEMQQKTREEKLAEERDRIPEIATTMWLDDRELFEAMRARIVEDGHEEFDNRSLAALVRDFPTYYEQDDEPIRYSPLRSVILDKDPVVAALLVYSDMLCPQLMIDKQLAVTACFKDEQASDITKGLYRHLLTACAQDSPEDYRDSLTLHLSGQTELPTLPSDSPLITEFEENRASFRWAVTGDAPGGFTPILPEKPEFLSYILLSQAAEMGPNYQVKTAALEAMRKFDEPYALLIEESLEKRGKLF